MSIPWWKLHGSALRDKTRKGSLDRIVGKLGDPLGRQLTPAMFSHYRSENLGRITANTLNHHLIFLNAVFNELSRLGEWTGPSPLAGIRKLKVQETEMAYLDDGQIDTLLGECRASRNPDTELCAELCLDTGARWSEAETIELSQIKNCLVTFVKTKGNKSRSIPITDDLQKRLREHAKNNGRSDSRIFSRCYDALVKALARSEIKLPKGQATHVLRHTFASHFVMNGGNIIMLQRILGHVDITTTMRYAHLASEHLEEVLKFKPLG